MSARSNNNIPTPQSSSTIVDGVTDPRPVAKVPDYGPSVLAAHAEKLHSSGISSMVAKQRGYRTVETQAELKRMGLACSAPALVFPLWGVHGDLVGWQARPDMPRVGKNGRLLKYEFPRYQSNVLDVPRSVTAMLGDPSVRLVITEGTLKADSAVSIGMACVSIGGVWNWRATNSLGGKVTLADFDEVAFNDRIVVLAFDSDAVNKPSVQMALSRFAGVLSGRGAQVRYVRWCLSDGVEVSA